MIDLRGCRRRREDGARPRIRRASPCEAGRATADPSPTIRSDTDVRADFAARAHQLIGPDERPQRAGRPSSSASRHARFQGLQARGAIAERQDRVQLRPATPAAGSTGDLEQDLTDLLVEVGQAAPRSGHRRAVSHRRDAVPRQAGAEAVAAALHRISQLAPARSPSSAPACRSSPGLIGGGASPTPSASLPIRRPRFAVAASEAATAALSEPAGNLGCRAHR